MPIIARGLDKKKVGSFFWECKVTVLYLGRAEGNKHPKWFVRSYKIWIKKRWDLALYPYLMYMATSQKGWMGGP
jgi:hypothetical protein